MSRASDREAQRERIREKALKEAAKLGLTLRCQYASMMTGADEAQVQAIHRQCRGEDKGGAGCLCPCHDLDEGEP